MKINIKGKEVELRYTFRSLILFENIANKTFDPTDLKMTDIILYMLCTILASDKTVELKFDELVDMIDEDPKIMEEFSNWLIAEYKKQMFMAQDTEVEVDEEKKS